jgi:hypothetical protein
MPSLRPFRRLALATLVAVLAGTPAAAQTYDAATRTVTVAPSGVDDTRAIATAFDVCRAVGPGCTVQLTEGTFLTRQHERVGFQGAFAGAGMDATEIRPLTPLPIRPARVDLATSWPEPGFGSVLFTFDRSDVVVRDLAFFNDDPAPSEPWRFAGGEIRALAVFLVFQGPDSRVDVRRVAIESGPGVFFGFSVINGIYLHPGIDRAAGASLAERIPFSGTASLTESRIRGPIAGIAIENVEGATVVVRDNVIEAVEAVEIVEVGTSVVDVRGNLLVGSGDDPGVVTVTAGRYKTPAGPTTVVLADNTIRLTSHRNDVFGVILRDATRPATQRVVVERNTFELDGGAAAVGGNAEGVVVRDNVVRGRAPHGVRVGTSVARPWVVVGNQFGDFDAGQVALLVGSSARGTVVVCNEGTSLRDDGRGTVAVGCD